MNNLFCIFSDYSDYGSYGGYGTEYDFFNIISELPDIFNKIKGFIAFISLVIGIIQCFFGYKLYRITTAISGFITGSMIGCILGALCAVISKTESLKNAAIFVIISMLIFGIIGAMVAYCFELVGAFLIGFSGVYIISLIISIFNRLAMQNTNLAPSFFIAGIPAVAAGLLVVKYWKPIVIIYTGLAGAMCIASGTSWGIMMFIICSIAGIIFQVKMNNGLTDKPKSGSVTYTSSPAYTYPTAPTPPAVPVHNTVQEEKDTADKYPNIVD